MTDSKRSFSGALLVANIILMSIVLTTAFASPSGTRFKEIDVERINIVEADGRVRMVIANKEKTPGPMEHGEPFGYGSGERQGLIFYNDEQTESGGLIFSGKTVDGKTTAVGSLTFDQYNRDQNMALQYIEDGGNRRTGLAFNEYPGEVTGMELDRRYDLAKALTDSIERRAALDELRQFRSLNRLWIGRQFDGTAGLILSDAEGKPRLWMRVDSAGSAAIDFFDEEGEVIRSIGPNM